MVLVQQVQGVATLALGGNPVSQFFDCNSTTGSNAIANLVWEKEGGNIRFAIQERSKRKRLDLVQSNGGPLLNYDDEGIYTCRDIVTGESVSLNVTGGKCLFQSNGCCLTLGGLHLKSPKFDRNLNTYLSCHNFSPLSSVQILLIPACCLLCVL